MAPTVAEGAGVAVDQVKVLCAHLPTIRRFVFVTEPPKCAHAQNSTLLFLHDLKGILRKGHVP